MSETEDKKEDYPNRIMEQCKILYCQKDLPMTKTCMCWGWECGPGWHPALNVLSCKLEALNLLYYDKYKVRIQADQVKEKFGTLHFYYSVECDNYTERGLELKKLMDDFDEKKSNGYFGIQHIVDEKGYSEEVDRDGKKCSVWHPPQVRTVATEHVEEYESMKKAVDAAYGEMVEKGRYEPTDEQKVIMTFMEAEAERLVREAEEACYDACECCGRQIGTDYSPRCTTKGWIRYVCKECLEKDNARMKAAKEAASEPEAAAPAAGDRTE